MCEEINLNNRKNYQFMQNVKCEWFPCHKTENVDTFNCLFCFCPLYYLDTCNGNYAYTKDGIKDCQSCVFPHERENYEKIIDAIKANNKKCGECNNE